MHILLKKMNGYVSALSVILNTAFRRHRTITPIMTILTGLLSISIASVYIYHNATIKDELRFHNAIQRNITAFSERTNLYITLLRSGSALFAASNNVTKEEFKQFVKALDLEKKYTGVQGLGYSIKLEPSELDAFIDTFRSVENNNFKVWPLYERPEYHSIMYLEPENDRNKAAIGFDMHSEKKRRQAMDKARDTGMPAATEKVMLVQEITNDKYPGFLIYLPVYRKGVPLTTVEDRRKALKGFVYSPFRAPIMLKSSLHDKQLDNIEYDVYSGNVDKSNLLFSTRKQHNSFFSKSRLHEDVTIKLAGHPWIFQFYTTDLFYRDSDTLLIPYIVGLGLSITFLLYLFTQMQQLAWSRAESITEELRQSEKHLIKLEKQKDEFIGIASHELKTPMTSIKAFVQLLYRYLDDKHDIKGISYLSRIQTQTDRLVILVNDLLDISRIESGKLALNKEVFVIDTLVNDVIEEIQPTASNRPIIKSGHSHKNILGDRFRVGQVITNFLTNAIKYSPNNKEIIVSITEDSTTITVSVKDYGIGISSDQLPRIFDRFYRVEGRKEMSFPGLGLGLGLYISAEIIRRHHGRIWAESKPNNGSTFYFSLPIITNSRNSTKG